jgi:hypothetical protein
VLGFMPDKSNVLTITTDSTWIVVMSSSTNQMCA